MRLRVLATAALALPSAVAAQKPLPRLYLAPEVVIERQHLRGSFGSGIGKVTVGPDGRIVTAPKELFGAMLAFDAQGKPLKWDIPVGARDADLGWVTAMGWVGNTLWAADDRFKQFVLIDPSGKVIRSIEYPSWVHPHWAERRKYPLYGGLSVVGVYPDSSLLVQPWRPRGVLDTPGFDKTREYWMRTDADGAIQRVVQSFSYDDTRIVLQGPGRTPHVMMVPFAPRTWRQLSPDGRRIVVISPAIAAADSGRYRVTALTENGDTVFSRRFAGPVAAVTAKQVDSALSRIQGYGDRTADQVRADLRRRIPAYHTFITAVVAGLDHSTWIFSRSPVDSVHIRSALVLDEKGEPLVTVDVPQALTPMVVTRDHLWAAQFGKEALIRYKLQATPPPPAPAATPAPPARTAPAARAKAPAQR